MLFFIFVLVSLVCAKKLGKKKRHVSFDQILEKESWDPKRIFSEIYKNRYWSNPLDENNLSGPGSIYELSLPYMNFLQKYIDEKNPKSVVDLGCGNWELMKHISLKSSISYLGIDLVDSVIEENVRKYSSSNVAFMAIRNISEIKNITANLLIIKDVMQHWNNRETIFFLRNILPNFEYAILAHGYSYERELNNVEIKTGKFRFVDLEAEPFHLKVSSWFDYKHPLHRMRVYLYRSNSTIWHSSPPILSPSNRKDV